MSKPTPGPWHVEPLQSDHGGSLAICGPAHCPENPDYEELGIIAIIWPMNADDEPNYDTAVRHPSDVANANLLAAAPSLLAACELMLEQLRDDYQEPDGTRWQYALDAIAAAKGEAAKVEEEVPRDTDASHWDEIPGHPIGDWQTEVSNGDTMLGYRNWVKSRREMQPDEYWMEACEGAEL